MPFIPPFFLDCVVAIGFPGPSERKSWVASGFIYGHVIDRSDSGKNYRMYLATNRHVLKGEDTAYLRFNPEAAGPAREYRVLLRDPTTRKLYWIGHPDAKIDLAVLPIDANTLREQGIKFSSFDSDDHVLDRAAAKKLGLTEGDGVYVLGFPLGLVGGERNFVIVRQGAIARIRDALAGVTKEFLVDAFIFPGNSGGPVITKPEISTIQSSLGESNVADGFAG